MPYIVDTGIPVKDSKESVDRAFRYSSTMDVMANVIADGYSESSGMGFGYRDVQYRVSTRRKARRLADEFRQLLNIDGYTVEDVVNGEPQPYVSVHYQYPYWIFRIADKFGLGHWVA
jgi:hypothetical protein